MGDLIFYSCDKILLNLVDVLLSEPLWNISYKLQLCCLPLMSREHRHC